MSAELGTTNDPRELVPGDVGAIVGTMYAMRSYGDSLREAGTGLSRVDTQDGWSGAAADQFRSRFHGEPTRWIEAGDGFHSAADALDRYANTLQWAQEQAGEAITLWNQGEQATQQAVADYNRAVDRANAQAGNGQPVAPIGPFSDPGAGQRAAAERLLAQARDGLSTAGDDAANTVGQACQKAPEKPGFWAKVGDFLGDAASAVGGAVKETVLDVGDALASYGNAMIHHPEDVAALIGGTMLAGVSAVGDGLGGVLDATGVGAVAGVPINVVSTAGVVAGAGIMTMAAADLGHHAATDDAVHTEREPEPTPEERPTSKTDRLKEHLSERDLDAARRELDGEVVARKPDGTPWDHVTEVREAQRGLVNRIGQINRALGDPRLGAAERAALQDELSQASRLLDHSEGFVPR